jgi:hypothetical protein
VPLRLKPTNWESVFDSRSSNSADPDRCVYFLSAGQRATPGVAPIATRDMQVTVQFFKARGSGRQRVTPAPGEQGVQFTASSKELQGGNRDLGTVEHVLTATSESGQTQARKSDSTSASTRTLTMITQ